ncbi:MULTISPECIES: hypothetical protein [Pelosinus]|uniref:Uncharacterized protein n=1 Tax=Pelosinus fermentans B4 TaxID=1149862 RepID=I9LHT7_9FIRM|nr:MULTISPECIES: hypothetical protein [Pelosinus]EIW19951.1 hypothetical protein FB4_0202 [Pelosinus fermentans B4]EIW21192.1 hypothetical protein FA11_0919 [Pelosinus fermentans A11]
MAKYKKKPVVIDAERYDGTEDSVVKILAMATRGVGAKAIRATFDGLLIPTLEGVMLASVGDYIIKGVAGELYPCKPDIFASTYEKADSEKEERCTCDEPQPVDIVRTRGYDLVACYKCGKVVHEVEK